MREPLKQLKIMHVKCWCYKSSKQHEYIEHSNRMQVSKINTHCTKAILKSLKFADSELNWLKWAMNVPAIEVWDMLHSLIETVQRWIQFDTRILSIPTPFCPLYSWRSCHQKSRTWYGITMPKVRANPEEIPPWWWQLSHILTQSYEHSKDPAHWEKLIISEHHLYQVSCFTKWGYTTCSDTRNRKKL